ncbi:hypothetical protein AAVH_01956 [Aphelenchoides avenae]|nr:hypothetical protein AAVH_01956 [Aphelenchus avenae]
MPMPATNPNAFRRFNSVRGDFVSKTTDGIRTLFNEPIHEGEDEQEADRRMRTSTSLQFNVQTECDKENQAATSFYLQGISNPGLQDTPKHLPLSGVSVSYTIVCEWRPRTEHAECSVGDGI